MESPVEPNFGDPLLDPIDLPPEPDWSYLEGPGAALPADSVPDPISPLQTVGFSMEEAAAAQYAGNRAMAAQLGALAAALQTSRQHPSVYLMPGGLNEPDAVELSVRAAAVDAALRLHLTPNQVRTRAHEGQVLADSLPRLWQQFRLGLTSYAHAQAAVQHLSGLSEPAAIDSYDRALAERAGSLAPGAFRQHARRLQERLLAEPAAQRHTRALAERRVYLEPVEDGMAWLHILGGADDMVRITARLDATARRAATAEKAATSKHAPSTADDHGARQTDRRTLMQIRTDLAVAWLAGDGTPTAAKVRPLLLVPILSLLGKGTEPAILHGYGPIDPATAARLFHDAPAFRRVGTDPISGEMLNLDRTRYRPSKAQREWLVATYGSCARPGCTSPASQADIDHVLEWARDHGPTNIGNLLPLCGPDHRLKTLSKIRIRKEADDTVTITTPTGHRARSAPPHYGADPPF